MVVMPPMVVETSLTMVLAEPPPPPDPELPPADCADDVADVSDAADADDVAEVDEAAEDDVTAVDWDVEAVTADEAIAEIDMKPRSRTAGAAGAFHSPFNGAVPPSRRCAFEKTPLRPCASPAMLSNQSPRHELQLLPVCPGQHERLRSPLAGHE